MKSRVINRPEEKNLKVEVMGEVAEITLQKSTGWLKYGSNDKLPNDLVKAIGDSGTATACVNRLNQFIEAEGFIDETAKAVMVNPVQTAEEFLSELVPSESVFEAHALRILLAIDGSIGSVEVLPIKTLRRLEDGSWRYNPLMGEKNYLKSDDILYPNINPKTPQAERAKMLKEHMKQHGGTQIGFVYCSFQKTLQQYGDMVPIPACWSGLEDIQTDAALQRLDRRNVKKGFRADVVVSMPGEVDAQTIDEETGLTEMDMLDNTLKSFVGEEASPIIMLQSKVNGIHPKLDIFPFKDILNGTANSRDRIPKAVCRHMNVPPILVGFEVPSVIGSDKAVLNSLKMFLFSVRSRQRRIERTMSMLFPEYDWTLSQVNPYDYLPPEVLATLTTDEKRALGGYESSIGEVDKETQTLVARLNQLNPAIAQKVMDTMTPEQILKLVGLSPNGTA